MELVQIYLNCFNKITITTCYFLAFFSFFPQMFPYWIQIYCRRENESRSTTLRVVDKFCSDQTFSNVVSGSCSLFYY